MEQDQDQHKRQYSITVDQKHMEWLRQFITGAEIKKLVNAPLDFGVWLIVAGPAEDEEIADSQNVDLSSHKQHKFITGPKHTTEGEGELFLPSRDREYLTEKGLTFEETVSDGQRGIVLRNYSLPSGLFDALQADILILLPPGYPDTKPDMFYTFPWVKLTGKNVLPRAADHSHLFDGQSWQRWSRHSNEWRAGVDGIWTMLKLIDHALGVAAA